MVGGKKKQRWSSTLRFILTEREAGRHREAKRRPGWDFRPLRQELCKVYSTNERPHGCLPFLGSGSPQEPSFIHRVPVCQGFDSGCQEKPLTYLHHGPENYLSPRHHCTGDPAAAEGAPPGQPSFLSLPLPAAVKSPSVSPGEENNSQ